jgi:Big-like domain-containing protein
MHRSITRVARAVTLALGAISCSDRMTSAHDRLARLAIVPQLSTNDRAIVQSLSAFALDIDNVHVAVFRPNADAMVVDTVVAFPSAASEISIQIPIELQQPEEQLSAAIELRAGTTTLFSGTQTVVARVGQTSGTKAVSLTYVGPGATARLVRIAPRTPATYVGGTYPLLATATDLQGVIVESYPISWASTNAAIATVDNTGSVSGASAGTASIVARGITGIADTVVVSVSPPPVKLALVSGDTQSAVVGRDLPSALVVQALSATGAGVPGVPVTFRVIAGTGAFTVQTLRTDDKGVVSNSLSLGTAAGPLTIEAASGALSTTFHATALPDAAAQLLAASQPSALVGQLTDVPPAVQIADSFGNPVPIQGVTVSFSFDVSDTSSTFAPNQTRSATALTDSKGVALAPSVTLNSAHDITINAIATVNTTRIQGTVPVRLVVPVPAKTPAIARPLP